MAALAGNRDVVEELLERQPRPPEQRLFINHNGEPLSALGVRFKLAPYVKAATTPTLRGKLVMPHAVRHATAVRLISAGVASPSSAAGSAM